MKKGKICEMLNIENEMFQSDKIKLLIGDMELSFWELISCVKYSVMDDAIYNKHIGEVRAYLNCLKIFEIINDVQCEKMYEVLDEMDEMRLANKKNH